jgi:LmbE family N-acetylglucosaminyl deacetylase
MLGLWATLLTLALAARPKDVYDPVALNISAWIGKTVLMLGAHPDDIECGAAGLASLLTTQGTKVVYVITTNGDKGCGSPFCVNYTSQQLAAARYQEAINAAAVVGVPESNVVMMDYEDGMITSYPESALREELVTIFRRWQPTILMTWYPQMRFDLKPSKWDDLGYHPDHQATARLGIDAGFDAGVGLMFPNAGPAWRISELYTWEFGSLITHFADIGGSPLSAKIRATQAHKTQYPTDVTQEMEQLGKAIAALLVDKPSVTYAEGFLGFF